MLSFDDVDISDLKVNFGLKILYELNSFKFELLAFYKK